MGFFSFVDTIVEFGGKMKKSFKRSLGEGKGEKSLTFFYLSIFWPAVLSINRYAGIICRKNIRTFSDQFMQLVLALVIVNKDF